MNIKNTVLHAFIASVLLVIAATAPGAESVSVLLQKGIFAEETEGDLKAAIHIYNEVVTQTDQNRALAAQALYRLGLCQQKLGNREEATTALNRLLREYTEQESLVALARKNLPQDRPRDSQVHIAQIAVPSGWGFSISKDGRYAGYHPSFATGDVAVYEWANGKVRTVVTFKKNEGGAWDDILVSPQSDRVAYTVLGTDGKYHIYVSSMEAPAPRELLKSTENDWIDVLDWSPDGRHLAIAKGRGNEGEWGLVNAEDDQFERLRRKDGRYSFSQVGFSPDGRYLCYRAGPRRGSDESTVYVFGIATRQEHKLPLKQVKDLVGWAPRSNRLLFTSDRSGEAGLWAIEVRDGEVHGDPQLIRANLGSISPRRITDDGRFFFIQQTKALNAYTAVVDFETGAVLKQPSLLSEENVGYNTIPAWSPDGKWVGYNIERDPRKYVLFSPDTGERRTFALSGKTRMPFRNYVWLPGQEGLLVNCSDTEGRFGIYKFRFNSGELTPYPLNQENEKDWCVFPQWLEEGKSLVYFRRTFFSRDGKEESKDCLIQRDFQTGAEKDFYLPEGKLDGMWPFALSPDRKQLALVTAAEGQGQRVIIDSVGGGSARELARTEAGRGIQSVDWSANGRRIVYVDEDDQERNVIWSVDLASGHRVKLKLDLPRLRWISLHPDGKTIAFQAGDPGKEDLWVMESFLPRFADAK